jgi:hypothetical protein
VLPDLSSHLRPPYGLLIFGVFILVLAVAGTCTGTLWGRGGPVYRAEKPTQFLWGIALYYLLGVGFVGYFLYRVYGFSN